MLVGDAVTQQELETLLDGQPLLQTLDVKTLVLDQLKTMRDEDLLDLFWDKLPNVSHEEVRGYLYMKRS